MSASGPSGSHHLSEAELATLDRDGYVMRRNVFAPADVADMVRHCEALVDRLVTGRQAKREKASVYTFDTDFENLTRIKWEGDTDVVHGIEPFAHLSAPLQRWAYDARLTHPMESLVGHGEPALFTEKLNLKRPRVGGRNPLHQDYPYWVGKAEDAREVATTIIFLDDATIKNGCLWVVPGSHKQGMWTTRKDGDEFAHNEVDTTAYPQIEEVPIELGAGSTVSFGAFLVHRSTPNRSVHHRRALLYSYQPPGRRTQVDRLRAEGEKISIDRVE